MASSSDWPASSPPTWLPRLLRLLDGGPELVGTQTARIGNAIGPNDPATPALAVRFATGKKRTEAEKLRAAVAAKVARLAGLNPTRADWAERFQQLIDEYNAGSVNVEAFSSGSSSSPRHSTRKSAEG